MPPEIPRDVSLHTGRDPSMYTTRNIPSWRPPPVFGRIFYPAFSPAMYTAGRVRAGEGMGMDVGFTATGS